MTDLLLVFFAAAYLDNLVLIGFFDGAMATSRPSARGICLVAGLLLVLAAVLHGWPAASARLAPQASVFLLVLACTSTAIGIAQSVGDVAPGYVRPGLRRLRAQLPLVVANLAAMVFAWLEPWHGHGIADTAGFCLAASAGFLVVSTLFSAMRDRLAAADIPRRFQGTPIVALTACLMALAMMGFARSLPW